MMRLARELVPSGRLPLQNSSQMKEVVCGALPMWRPPCSDVRSSRARATLRSPSAVQQHLLGICSKKSGGTFLPVLKLGSVLHCFFSKLIALCVMSSNNV